MTEAQLLASLSLFRKGQPLEACKLLLKKHSGIEGDPANDEWLVSETKKILAGGSAHGALASLAKLNLAYLCSALGEAFSVRTLLESTNRLQANELLLEAAEALCANHDALEESIRLAERAQELNPTVPRACRIADYHMKLGHFDIAEAQLLRLVGTHVNIGGAYQLLANTRKYDQSDEGISKELEARLDRNNLDEASRICLHFALGKIFDDLSHYDRAFAHYKTGNELRKRFAHFSSTAWQQRVQALTTFRPVKVERPNANIRSLYAGATKYLFIVGMPRSGTTMMHEQLSRLKDVTGLGEQEHLDRLNGVLESKTSLAYPAYLARLQPSDWTEIQKRYAGLVARGGTQATGTFIDKNPLNFTYVALIEAMFDNASVVHMTRDPLDTCLSIYFQNFAHPKNDYAYSLEEIADFYNGYRALMDHWYRYYAEHIIPVQYEELVRKTDLIVRDTANLARIRAMFDPDGRPANSRVVSTASLWQSRQPIYATSIGRSHHYMKYLQPLLARIDPRYLR